MIENINTIFRMVCVTCLMALCAMTLSGCEDGIEDEMSFSETSLNDVKKDLYVSSSNVWSSSNIPVCWENEGFDTPKGWIRSAMLTSWEGFSSVRFTGWGMCNSNSNGLRIRLINSGGSTKALGTALNGVKDGVKLGIYNTSLCGGGRTRQECVVAVAVHEFGHALGFSHEQNRPDTPASSCDTCQYNSDCSSNEYCSGGICRQGDNGNVTVGPWDIDSVMNYCNPVWNGNGRLSATDIRGAIAYYGDAGRLTNANLFNASVYLSLYADLRNAFGSTNYAAAKRHWLMHGIHEGRRASNTVHSTVYLNRYVDLQNAFTIDPLAQVLYHWISFGMNEGRIGI